MHLARRTGIGVGFTFSIAGIEVQLVPDQIDALNAAALGAGLGAATMGGIGLILGRDYGRLAAAGAFAGMIGVPILVALVALVYS